MTEKRTCSTCDSAECSARNRKPEESLEQFLERQQLQSRLCQIKHKIIVLSGKGGVGKSTVAVNLALALSLAGRRVGLLDVVIHGASIPNMLRLEGRKIRSVNDTFIPVEVGSLKVMSIGFLLSGPDNAVIWRGPLKMGVIKQFLKDVAWGELDYLVIDCPPGTGDEPLSVAQLIADADGAVIVTTPQKVALIDVRKCVNFCHQLNLPVLGVIENMSGFVCPKCGEIADIFKKGGGEKMAVDMGVPFLGRIPLDSAVVESGDTGRPCVHHQPDTLGAKALAYVADTVRKQLEGNVCHAR